MTATKVPVTTDKTTEPATTPQAWQPIETLRNEIDRLFDNFGRGFWSSPFRSLADFEPRWPSTAQFAGRRRGERQGL